MRLIQASTLVLHDFSLKSIPPYAILSHTWSDDEVSFQDMSAQTGRSKGGFIKIEQSCRLAVEDKLDYVWVDTCCIDKTSSAELSESINSMFRFYQDAAVCYTYLADLRPDSLVESMLACRWFTRGWTLQELIAPRKLKFYDSAWKLRGHKSEYARMISSMTGIADGVLVGNTPMTYYSIAQKMSWAAERETTRFEDQAYCLLGIFDVNMPLLYGEGERAFLRLQEQIIARTGDLTLLAYHRPLSEISGDLLAHAPKAFAQCSEYVGALTQFGVTNLVLTQEGLLLSGNVDIPYDSDNYFLEIASRPSRDEVVFLILRRFGPTQFRLIGRHEGELRQAQALEPLRSITLENCCIAGGSSLVDTMIAARVRHHEGAIRVVMHNLVSIVNVTPRSLWDPVNCIVYKGACCRRAKHSAHEDWNGLLVAFELMVRLDHEQTYSIGLLLSPARAGLKCSMFLTKEFCLQNRSIFSGLAAQNSMYWVDLEYLMPELSHRASFIHIETAQLSYRIQCSMTFGPDELEQTWRDIWFLDIQVISLPTAISP